MKLGKLFSDTDLLDPQTCPKTGTCAEIYAHRSLPENVERSIRKFTKIMTLYRISALEFGIYFYNVQYGS